VHQRKIVRYNKAAPLAYQERLSDIVRSTGGLANTIGMIFINLLLPNNMNQHFFVQQSFQQIRCAAIRHPQHAKYQPMKEINRPSSIMRSHVEKDFIRHTLPSVSEFLFVLLGSVRKAPNRRVPAKTYETRRY
jgi:hypothetical protein